MGFAYIALYEHQLFLKTASTLPLRTKWNINEFDKLHFYYVA